MFTRKLVTTNKVPQDLLDKLNNNYIKPGAWDINDENVNKFKEIMKNALQELQDGKCAYCELPLATRNPEIEHIAPKGGIKRVKHIECMFLPENLVYACHNCNSTECKGQIPKVDADSYHTNKAKNTIKMFRLDSEKVLELAKEYMTKRHNEEFNYIIQSVSSYRPELQ